MQLPKDCYCQYEVLSEKMKENKISFNDMIQELVKPGYWVEVDWRKSTRLQKKEIRSTPMLLVSVKKQTINKSFAEYSCKKIGYFVRGGGQIYLSATVVNRCEYKKK